MASHSSKPSSSSGIPRSYDLRFTIEQIVNVSDFKTDVQVLVKSVHLKLNLLPHIELRRHLYISRNRLGSHN